MVKHKSLLPKKMTALKLVPWQKVVPQSTFKLEKDSRAGVIVDQKGAPKLFIFDTFALLDILSAIDERLVDRFSTKEYYSKKINPTGWLIDQIEAQLPLNPEYVQTLKSALDEAYRKGWVPFSRIQAELDLI